MAFVYIDSDDRFDIDSIWIIWIVVGSSSD